MNPSCVIYHIPVGPRVKWMSYAMPLAICITSRNSDLKLTAGEQHEFYSELRNFLWEMHAPTSLVPVTACVCWPIAGCNSAPHSVHSQQLDSFTNQQGGAEIPGLISHYQVVGEPARCERGRFWHPACINKGQQEQCDLPSKCEDPAACPCRRVMHLERLRQ